MEWLLQKQNSKQLKQKFDCPIELSVGWSGYSGGSCALTKQIANSKRCHKNRNMSNLTIKLRYV